MYETRIIDLAHIYTVSTESGRYLLEESNPFVHGVELHGPKGETVRLRGVFDDGATINVIDEKTFAMVKHRLNKPNPSDRIMRMADGSLVPSVGNWMGTICVGGVSMQGGFEIFPSGNSWALLFGKPLLKIFDMTHRYKDDTISLEGPLGTVTLPNQFGKTRDSASAALAGVSLTADVKQRKVSRGTAVPPQDNEATKQQEEGTKPRAPGRVKETKNLMASPSSRETALGDHSSPVREVSTVIPSDTEIQHIDTTTTDHTDHPNRRTTVEDIPDEGETDYVHPVTTEPTTSPNTTDAAQPDVITNLDKSIFTRFTQPNQPERMQKILELVTIGDDLTTPERETVRALIVEFADCFALSVSEVKTVKNGEHKLDIKPGTKFSTKVANRPLSPPQKEYFNKVLDELLSAGVIRPIAAEDVKCCSPVTISQKAHSGGGLTINELIYRLEDQCIAAGRKPAENLPPREGPPTSSLADFKPTEPKFRFCMNYGELNKSTVVRPMPQGNIRGMQQNLSGKRWISKFDFASGFYACPVAKESQPYAAFYAGSRGYMTWNRMPFGFTGAPTTFHGVTSRALGDLVGTVAELFTDDGGIAGDDFNEKMKILRTVLERVRKEDLSLLPQKTSLFMSEVVFVGKHVGQQGIRPDLTKLTAVVN